ncbi:MAG: radical SAM protein [Acidobacteria bacterium]|jgi:radical SAM superfamily enzyme YgiQ (UPF0313 family)|nr:radical SAM protein [Acidobacteriota bacterium]
MNYSWHTTIPPETGAGGKEKINVLLVSLDCTVAASRTPMLAPAFLIAHARRNPLTRNRVEFEIKQFGVEEAIENTIEEILSKKYHAIGFSCYVWNFMAYKQIIPILKRIHPHTILIMGGQQLLGQEHSIFKQIPGLDILVYEDGEVAFSDIIEQIVINKYDWSAVGGILFRSAGEIIDTYSKKKHIKFADIASPYLEGIITGRHSNLNIETYRGCPNRCAFCAWGKDKGQEIDPLPLDRVRRELTIMGNMGVNTLGFFDSNFNLPQQRGEQILDIILENEQFKMLGTSIFAQYLQEDLIRKMSHIQTNIGVGLQSTEPQTNITMRRQFSMAKMTAGVHLLKKYKLQFILQIIIGLPGDTYQSIWKTLNYALQLHPPVIDAFRLMVLPGTGYRRRAEELGIIYESLPNHYIICNNNMNITEINRAERMAQALTILYNLPRTRKEMFAQASKNNETTVGFCDAIGAFMDNFNLLDREELRKGNIIRKKDEATFLKILHDFKRFRKELAGKLKTK